MECPVCQEDLAIVQRQGVELDYCLECQGLWFESGELTQLAKARKEEIYLPDILNMPLSRENVIQTRHRCPKCDRRMEKFWLGGNNAILVDRCPVGDGIWFDQAELEDVMQLYREQRDLSCLAAGSVSILGFVGEALCVEA